jgi:hypothetical protein
MAYIMDVFVIVYLYYQCFFSPVSTSLSFMYFCLFNIFLFIYQNTFFFNISLSPSICFMFWIVVNSKVANFQCKHLHQIPLNEVCG